MSGPRLTEQAEADLDDLWNDIAKNNLDAADRMVDAVLAGATANEPQETRRSNT